MSGRSTVREPAVLLEQAHQRLRHLYEISKILLAFDTVESTILKVLAVVARTISLHSAIFVLQTDRTPRMVVWHAEGQPARRLRAASARARAACRYLVRSGVHFGAAPGEGASPPAQTAKNFIVLPLAVANRPIFGALQFETPARLDELDLVLVNAVVNQVSIAVDRHVTVEARQAAVEAKRRDADQRRVTATDQLEFVRAVTGSLGDGVIAVDLDGQVTLFNPAAAQMLGRAEKDVLGKPLAEILQIHRMDGTPILAAEFPVERVMSRGGSVRGEEQLFCRDGRPPIAVAHTATALRRDGRLSGAVLAFQDITTRRRAEELTARLAAIVTSSDDAIFSHDLEGIIQTWNDGAKHLFGYSVDEAIGRSCELLMPPDLVEDGEESRLRARVGNNETVERHETMRRRKDGTLVAVSLTASPIRDPAGRVIGVSKIARDVTYRRREEEARKRAEMEQRLLAEVATIVGSSLDRRATLSAVARCLVPVLADACLIDELRADDVRERREVVFADERKQREFADRIRAFAPKPGWKSAQARVLESGKALLFEEITDPVAEGIAQDNGHAEAMRAAGTASMIALPLFARGKNLGVLTLVLGDSGRRYSPRDMSLAEEVARRVAAGLDNASLYEKAQDAIRAREELLAVVSHDLRNPLGAILLGIALLQRGPERRERRVQSRTQLERMERSARRMTALIEDLLDMASIEAGHLSIAKKRLAVRPLVIEALEAVSELAANKSVHLENDLPDELPMLWADASRVHQVLANLLGNAIKFTPKGGTVAVGAIRSGGWMGFSVRDTGRGIAQDDIPHLFERLWQARRGAQEGIGLGLSIVKGIVEAHGGTVWVESMVGRGSTFFFTLPVAHGDAAAAHDPTVPDAAMDTGMAIFDIRKVADDVVAALRPLAADKGLRFTVTAEAAIIINDPALTRLVLLTLVGSAVESTDRGAVDIAIERVAAGCRVAVRNPGPGLGVSQQGVPGKDSRLVQVRKLASVLGGHIELESEIGTGSTVTLTLPSLTIAPHEEHARLH